MPIDRTPIPFGKFRLVEMLGRGGMAEVWRAFAEGPGGFARTIVIKRILRVFAQDPRFVDLFRREATLQARLHHANIAQVFDFGQIDGDWFLAMEYLDGHDLGALLRASGPLPPPVAAYVVRDLCRALSYVHEATDEEGRPLGLVHRDVSLANVMVCFDGAVKLLDFGVAKALGHLGGLSASPGTLVGKPGYMAPEQLIGRGIDRRVDLYSAGVVLFEALTAQALFGPEFDPVRAVEERTQSLPRPSATNPRVPSELDRVFLRAVAFEPGERYHSAAEMVSDLDDVVHGGRSGPEALAAILRDAFGRGARTSISGGYPSPVAAAAAAAAPRPATGPRPAATEEPPTGLIDMRAAQAHTRIGRLDPSPPTADPTAQIRPPDAAPPRGRSDERTALLSFEEVRRPAPAHTADPDHEETTAIVDPEVLLGLAAPLVADAVQYSARADQPTAAITTPRADTPTAAIHGGRLNQATAAISSTRLDQPTAAISSTRLDQPTAAISSTRLDQPTAAVALPPVRGRRADETEVLTAAHGIALPELRTAVVRPTPAPPRAGQPRPVPVAAPSSILVAVALFIAAAVVTLLSVALLSD